MQTLLSHRLSSAIVLSQFRVFCSALTPKIQIIVLLPLRRLGVLRAPAREPQVRQQVAGQRRRLREGASHRYFAGDGCIHKRALSGGHRE